MSYLGDKPAIDRGVVMGKCGCCTRIDNDHRLKPVQFCRICNEWLCVPCSKSPWRRARAAAMKALGR